MKNRRDIAWIVPAVWAISDVVEEEACSNDRSKKSLSTKWATLQSLAIAYETKNLVSKQG